LGEAVDSLRAQTLPPHEVVLVIDHAPELLEEVRRLWPDLKIVANREKQGLSGARNTGVAEASGEVVAFLDDDAVPEPGWAAALLSRIALLPERAAALGGRILPSWEEPLPGWWPPSLRGVLTIIEWEGFGEVGVDLPDDIEIYGANMAFAAGPLGEVGGFPEALGRVGDRLLSGEEVEVVAGLRARGYRAFYEGAAAVRHSIQRDRLRPGWLLSRLLWQGATDALRDRAGGNGQRRLLGAEHLLLRLAGEQLDELLALDRLAAKQDLGGQVELLAVLVQHGARQLVRLLDDAPDLVVDLARDLVRVVGLGRELASEEGLAVVVAEHARAELL
jgi:glycosyltransferase involved in cell wall biosynthesis